MDLDQMAYRCPKAEVVEIVRLEGYRLTFAAAGSGLATIFPEEGSHVDGVLWSLTGDCEKSLDLYEGYPDFYDKQEITVKNKGGREIKAIVYIMTKDYMQNFKSPATSSPASRAKRAASPSVRLLSTPARCRSFAPSAARAPVWLTSSRTARRPAPARSAALSCEKGESKKWHV